MTRKQIEQKITDAIIESSIDNVEYSVEVSNGYLDVSIGTTNIYIEATDDLSLEDITEEIIKIINGPFDRGINISFRKDPFQGQVKTTRENLKIYY